ncbi:hypothetical protein PEC301937_14530 [Pectobacterium carotovorum subsp. carotovorum]|nr:hypothetical protein PEC301937_14530 [Pectobacterium carotovorum subsp. carotovorum]
MARITTPLTNTEIKAAKPAEKEYTLQDGKDIWRSLEKYVFPFIGTLPITQLTSRHFITTLCRHPA